MSHTNTTTNYALPQFITTDKPAWLTDINGAFSTIDTAVDAAKDAADAAQNNATPLPQQLRQTLRAQAPLLQSLIHLIPPRSMQSIALLCITAFCINATPR